MGWGGDVNAYSNFTQLARYLFGGVKLLFIFLMCINIRGVIKKFVDCLYKIKTP